MIARPGPADTTGIYDTAGHNHSLDWLRGVAAVAVVAFHFGRRLELPALFGHGYLAVDFFFVLSGFVIAKAYGWRLEKTLSARSYLLTRAIRLWPMVIFGTLLAALVEIGRPGIADQGLHLREGLTALALGSILLPMLGASTLEKTIFPLNGPMWTLFLEAFSNTAFIPWARLRLGNAWLYATMAASFPFLLYGAWKTGATEFGALQSDFALGFSRIGWSFAAGILLYRFRARAPRSNVIVISAILIGVLALPNLGWINPIFDVVAVLFILPLVIFLASASNFNRRWAEWSGNISYPLYAMHYPIVRLLGVLGLKLHWPAAGRIIFALAGLMMILTMSLAVFRFYDQPIRARLTSSLRRKRCAMLE